jgi:voltage-gated sodium channel
VDDVVPQQPARQRLTERAGRIMAANWFAAFSFGIIVLNALVLGLETYDWALLRFGGLLRLIEYLCLVALAAELAVRFLAQLATPARFFRDGWNLFDLAILLAPLLPGVRENISLLRLARLIRVLRTVRFFPSLQLIIGGVLRSLPGLASFLAIAAVVVYCYAMVGWMAFGEIYPEKYGAVGRAMLTLFLLLSLDGISDAFEAGRAVSDWSLLYYSSYVVVASYLLTNLLVGVVIRALEEAQQDKDGPVAREAERAGTPGPVTVSARRPEAAEPVAPAGAPAVAQASPEDVLGVRVAALRAALEELERELAERRQPAATGSGLNSTAGQR